MSSRMDRGGIDAFLEDRGTGVLSLARDDTPYAVPVSYGYEPATPAFYLRLSFHPDSRKHAFLAEPTAGHLVVYDRIDSGWVSVIAAGEIAEVEPGALTAEIAETLRRAELPLSDIIDGPPAELEYRLFRLTAAELTGRTTAL